MAHLQTAAKLQPDVAGFSLVEAEPQPLLPIAGVSSAWNKLLMQTEMVAPHLQVAVIEGEHGSGKHTLARYLHSRSPLSRLPFQRRDAREWLATEGDPGMIRGFLYLDRVDLLASIGQGLLLAVVRAVQDRPMGSAVLLASSQTPLRQMASQGQFIPDLAFRFTAVRFAVPPLRQRREDIAPITQALLDQLCARYQQQPVTMGPGSLPRLLRHTWPGNIRELACVLESALLNAENNVILPEHLALASRATPQAQPQRAAYPDDLSLDTAIRRHVEYVLQLNRGNKLRATRQLAISRSTLYRILASDLTAVR